MDQPTAPNIVHINEITRNLVRFCDKPLLATLARTSRLFIEDALDALWYELESLWHLLALFPNNLITYEAQGSFQPHLVRRALWSSFNRVV